MTEAIKVYPEKIVNHMKTIDNSLEYTLQAEDKENISGGVPIITRYDEWGKKHEIEADKVVRAIWKGVREGAAREMQREKYKQEVIDIANRYR